MASTKKIFMSTNTVEVNLRTQLLSACTCTCGDDDVGPTETREAQLPWSRFDVLVLLWGPRNNKQTGREIKKSTFQAVGEVGKQMIICSQFEIEIYTSLYS